MTDQPSPALAEAREIVGRLAKPLAVCPYDTHSPLYWTTPDAPAPCPFCGGTEDNDKCRGADMRDYDFAVSLLRTVVADETVEVVAHAYNDAFAKAFEGEDAHAPCSRCNGRGYHHGFGEDGHDPDWCDECGGQGIICTMTEDYASSLGARAVLTALLEQAREGT